MNRALRLAAAEQRSITFESPSPVTGAWVQVTAAPHEGGVGVYWRDITERKRTEQMLRANEEHLRLAQEAAGIGTWDWDLCRPPHPLVATNVPPARPRTVRWFRR